LRVHNQHADASHTLRNELASQNHTDLVRARVTHFELARDKRRAECNFAQTLDR
jgi:hypothetical protein